MVTAEWVTDASQESNGHPKSIRITSITDPLGIYRGTVWFTIIDVWFTIIDFTLWLFNITMENEPFIDDVPIRMVIFHGKLLNNQRVRSIIVNQPVPPNTWS